MKKLIIGGLVGGILLFLWQTLSWTVLNLHAKEYQQAPAEDTVLNFLNSQFSETGQYYLPHAKEGASTEEMQQMQKDMQGKPWVVVSYHKAYDMNMVTNIIRGLLVAIISAFFVCWILIKQTNTSFATTFFSSLLIGIVGYLFIPYSMNIWFQAPGAVTNFVDTLIAWGLCGLWLGWWLNRKK
jgi:hypothetical protein